LVEPFGDIITDGATGAAQARSGHQGRSVPVGLHDPDGIEIRLYTD